MREWKFAVPCLFGLEGLVGEELRRLDVQDVRVENGRVWCAGGPAELARINLCLRMGERALVWLGGFQADSFEALFQGVRALPLEDWIPRDGRFPVKGHCLDAVLHSVPDCQAIVKKAAADRLGGRYGLRWLPETGALYQLQFAIVRDRCDLFLDASGAGLHKRGYRAVGNEAPLRETLAAAMVQLARYRGRDTFLDPFCGSGTIPIEAALTALNRAPGLGRSFSAEHWPAVPAEIWRQERAAARDREFRGEYRIFGSDLDERSLEIARANARKAGVEGRIRFSRADAVRLELPEGGGVLVGNPPYGERMLDRKAAQELYRRLGRHLGAAEGWNVYLLSAEPEFERYFGRRADKRRKLYNGMLQCNLYMYLQGRGGRR